MNTSWIAGTNLMKHHCQIKTDFYGNLNMKDITNNYYSHAKIVFKIFNNKNLGDYHDLYVQSDILLLADVFQNFRKKSIEIYELDPGHFLTATGLAWRAYLKKTGIRLTDIVNRY